MSLWKSGDPASRCKGHKGGKGCKLCTSEPNGAAASWRCGSFAPLGTIHSVAKVSELQKIVSGLGKNSWSPRKDACS